jgi:ABC-type bacteriocin/lantibiotic exporter with double-glycine peptidase domain
MNLPGGGAFHTISQLFKVFNPAQKREFRGLVFLTFISSITDLLGLSLIIPIIGLVLSDSFYKTAAGHFPFLADVSQDTLLLYAVGGFFVLIIAKNLFGLYINKLQVGFTKKLYVSSSMNVLEKVYDRSMLNLQQETSNQLIVKLTNYQHSLCSEATISTIVIINEAMIFAMSAVAICAMNWQLFMLLVFVLLPVMGLFYLRVKSRIRDAGQQKIKNRVKLNADGQEMVLGYIDIKIAGTENYFKKQFREYADKFSRHQGSLDLMLFLPTRIIEVSIFVCVIIILLYGVYFIKDTEKIITTITLFSVIAYRCIPSINRFVTALSMLKSTEYVYTDPEFHYVDHSEKHHSIPDTFSFDNRIVFDSVSYAYPNSGKKIIDNCQLNIIKGEKIGIIGKSGAGKSTLIGLLLGFLHPSSGRITIDGRELELENMKGWWKILGYVKQDVFIMNASLRDNIAIGVPAGEVDDNKLHEALRLASLDRLIASWPEGADTILNEQGNNLSGGQRQRISIARAIYKGARILVFDEATSALDSQTEEEVTNAIHEIGRDDLTIVIIAHRQTSLKYCDKIYSLYGGVLSTPISYQELASKQYTEA